MPEWRPEAFGVLVDRYKEGIYAYTYDKLHNWQDAQDITQETFIQAYRKLHTLKRWDSFGSWLYRIASNLCKNWQIKATKRPDGDFIEDQNPAIIDEPSIKSYHEKEMVESVHDALSSLSETYREVLTLYYFGGMDSNKIAEVLGVSPTAIRLRLSRARSQLREEIFNMMSATYQQQKLRAGFTFRIVEAIKRIKINPISQTKSIHWGVSLALGMIETIIGLNPHLFTLELFNPSIDLSIMGESKVLDIGVIPVSVLKTAKVPLMSAQQGSSNGINFENMNSFFMAPQAQGGKWVKKADMPTSRVQFATAVVNGKIYAIGGVGAGDINFGISLSAVEEYD
jgi:RNA polymerase sigma-70 factor (ECF subfamily)